MDGEIDHGAGYGNTLNWAQGVNPGLGEQLVQVQEDLNTQKLYQLFAQLMTSLTPGARSVSQSLGGSQPGKIRASSREPIARQRLRSAARLP